MTKIRAAVKERKMLILDAMLCDSDEVIDCALLLTAAGMAKTITILKMNPRIDQNLRFALERSDGTPPAWMIFKQRAEFQKTLETNFHEKYPWIKEYVVTDPTQVRFDFVRSGQMTVNSVEAMLVDEELKDECQFVKCAMGVC